MALEKEFKGKLIKLGVSIQTFGWKKTNFGGEGRCFVVWGPIEGVGRGGGGGEKVESVCVNHTTCKDINIISIF